MERKGCIYREQFGYCWQERGQWLFQPVDVDEQPTGEPIKVELQEIRFHHEEDEEE
jgi:hypothetical protein